MSITSTNIAIVIYAIQQLVDILIIDFIVSEIVGVISRLQLYKTWTR